MSEIVGGANPPLPMPATVPSESSKSGGDDVARPREVLEDVGLVQESLAANVVSTAQVLASAVLNIRDTELSRSFSEKNCSRREDLKCNRSPKNFSTILERQ
ncbi:unnamed protein product [Fraxinus pennsylvanica]|uniref:Uncharacterized protein n=1 Tax=Fraxinus pennsylvanica TaxID=56036 RepID=A0AAD2AG36_9LAMI|nr:unnamed protein product [Fraxinus pennsylvanica]